MASSSSIADSQVSRTIGQQTADQISDQERNETEKGKGI